MLKVLVYGNCFMEAFGRREITSVGQNCNCLPFVPVPGRVGRRLDQATAGISAIDPDVIALQEIFPSRHNEDIARRFPDYELFAVPLAQVIRHRIEKVLAGGMTSGGFVTLLKDVIGHNKDIARRFSDYEILAAPLVQIFRDKVEKLSAMGTNAGGLVTLIKKDLLAAFGGNRPEPHFRPFSKQWDGLNNLGQAADALSGKGVLRLKLGSGANSVTIANIHNAWTYGREQDPVLRAQVQEGAQHFRELAEDCGASIMLGDMNHHLGGDLYLGLVEESFTCLSGGALSGVGSDYDSGQLLDWGIGAGRVEVSGASIQYLVKGVLERIKRNEGLPPKAALDHAMFVSSVLV